MPSADALSGQTLDEKYRIDRLIGRGGMGAVYGGEHIGTGRRVAVKVILPDLIRNHDAVERFRREALAAGSLRHPNIVDVTDFGITRAGGDAVAYLVMEFLQGSTLRTLIEEQGALPASLVAAIVEQIAMALEEAHAVGLVHRDLKPDNVWLLPDPRGGYIVRVIDFGIAKLRTADSPESMTVPIAADEIASETETVSRTQSAATPSGPRLTVAGSTIGTPAYMSPEQCRGEDVSPASDIYSLGVLAYEALSGKRPFTGTFPQLILRHTTEPPPRLDEMAGVPKRVANVIARALAKDPAERYPSAQAMAGSLQAAVEGPAGVIRRAAALYSDRLDTFFPISSRTFVPGLVLLAPFAALALAVWSSATPFILMAGVLLAWTTMTMMANAAFAVAIEHLRRRPLERLRSAEIFGQLRTRLGLPPDATLPRLLGRLTAVYLGSEFRGAAGQGDLAFLIALLEGVPPRETRQRCAILSKTAGRSYDLVRGLIVVTMLFLPALEGCVAYAILTMTKFARADDLAMVIAIALIPVNAWLVNPIFSSALALLYYRSRQANGEDLALAAL